MSRYSYGWVPQGPDFRDSWYAAPLHLLGAAPETLDLSAKLCPVLNQGPVGSCVLNTIDELLRYDLAEQQLPDVPTSRLFGYYNCRYRMGTLSVDSGCDPRTAMQCYAGWGAPAETLWPYDVTRWRDRPTDDAYSAGRENRITAYRAVVQSEASLVATLVGGKPFMLCFAVYESFESDAVAKTGVVPMPRAGERKLGGHAVTCYGYDRTRKVWLCRNHYGPDWGDKGNFTLPWAYALEPRLSGDYWLVDRVPEPISPRPMPPAVGAAVRIVHYDAAGHEVASYAIKEVAA